MKLEFAGVALKNPIIIASGPLTSSLDLLKKAEDYGAAGASLKLTFDRVPFPGKLRAHSLPGEGLLFGIDRRLNRDEGLELMRKAKEQTAVMDPTSLNRCLIRETPPGGNFIGRSLSEK